MLHITVANLKYNLEMESVFTKAYKYQQSESQNKLENYLTEIFVSILDKDLDFRSLFLKKIGIKNHKNLKFSIASQFTSNFNLRPDIKITLAQETIILIESKIDAKERPGQLEDYLKILKSEKKYKNKVLVYLSKFYENKHLICNNVKEEKYTTFHQIQWRHIHEICNKGGELVTELALFLNDKKIFMPSKITENDLTVLEHMSEAFIKFDEVLNSIKIIHKDLLEISLNQGKNLSNISTFGYYLLGHKNKFEFVIGFMSSKKLIYRIQTNTSDNDGNPFDDFKLVNWQVEEFNSQYSITKSKDIKGLDIFSMIKFLEEATNEIKEKL